MRNWTRIEGVANQCRCQTLRNVCRDSGRQEVARWFFRVGGAAKTVAKTISAYDMAVSDAIYGPTDRYVSRRRLKAMLDYGYDLILERLEDKRGATTAFFAFANTVATHREEGHGWLGIKFQSEPGADASEIYIHLRMLDRENVRQQEALGVIGVNLIYGTFYSHRQPDTLIRSLLDSLTWERVEVDMIRFAGPAFAGVDNRLMALQLVREGLTEAAMFTAQGGQSNGRRSYTIKPFWFNAAAFGRSPGLPWTFLNEDSSSSCRNRSSKASNPRY